MDELKESIFCIENRLEEINKEESYLRYSLKHLEQLFADVQSGKIELQ